MLLIIFISVYHGSENHFRLTYFKMFLIHVFLFFILNNKASLLRSNSSIQYVFVFVCVCLRQPYLDQKLQSCCRPTVRASQLLLH